MTKEYWHKVRMIQPKSRRIHNLSGLARVASSRLKLLDQNSVLLARWINGALISCSVYWALQSRTWHKHAGVENAESMLRLSFAWCTQGRWPTHWLSQLGSGEVADTDVFISCIMITLCASRGGRTSTVLQSASSANSAAWATASSRLPSSSTSPISWAAAPLHTRPCAIASTDSLDISRLSATKLMNSPTMLNRELKYLLACSPIRRQRQGHEQGAHWKTVSVDTDGV